MAAHLQQRPELLSAALATLFEIVLFEDCSNQWSLSRPMLSLILANEAAWGSLRARIITTQPQARPMPNSGLACAAHDWLHNCWTSRSSQKPGIP